MSLPGAHNAKSLIMFSLFRRKTIEMESLWAYRSRLPEQIEVKMNPSEDGGFTASVENIPGCYTEGDDFEQLTKMVNYAVYDHYRIPEEYFPYLHSFNPPQELVEKMKSMQAAGEKMPLNMLITCKAA